MKYLLLPLLFFLFIHPVSASPADSSTAITKPFNKSFIPSDAYIFYIIGDWGRRGEYHQPKVAEAMNICAGISKPNFIISTGDNFYNAGVSSTSDSHWKESFENIYNGNALRNIDWYPVLGNHDHYGNQQAEIDYSKINLRWKMPDDHYALDIKTADSTKITFVFTNSEPLSHLSDKKTASQWNWIDSTLAASTSTWKFVTGHHPIYSSSKMHGDTPRLKKRLKPLLEKYNAQAYFCGHDHDLQHQQPTGSKVDYFISGAGSELRPASSYTHTLFAKSIAGFAIVAITHDSMHFYFVDENANVIYSYHRGR